MNVTLSDVCCLVVFFCILPLSYINRHNSKGWEAIWKLYMVFFIVLGITVLTGVIKDALKRELNK
jgi:hypothetical protein